MSIRRRAQVLTLALVSAALGSVGATVGTGVAEPLDEELRWFQSEMQPYGIAILPLEQGYQAPIQEGQAEATAREEVPLAGDAEALSTLVRFSDFHYGPDPEEDGEVDEPFYVDVPAWMVTFSPVEMPLSQAKPFEGDVGVDLAATYTAGLTVFVDAESGEFLEFVTVAQLGTPMKD